MKDRKLARTSLSLDLPHTQCKQLDKENPFVMGGYSPVQAIMFTKCHSRLFATSPTISFLVYSNTWACST